jgi:thiol-disulfide isomerase/thioredoxin
MVSGDGGNRDRYIQRIKDSIGSDSKEARVATNVKKYFMDGFFEVLDDQAKAHNEVIPMVIINFAGVDDSMLREVSLLKVYNHLDAKTKDSYYGRLLQQYLIKFPGNVAPDFDSATLGGRNFNFQEDLRTSRYTLLDFWASYCKPCRAEIPNLLQLYSQYKDKGFNIVSVSLDTDPAIWHKTVALDNLTWTQVSDSKGAVGEAAIKYGANNGIPKNVLVDKDGKIIAWNLFGNDLLQQLRKLFSGDN